MNKPTKIKVTRNEESGKLDMKELLPGDRVEPVEPRLRDRVQWKIDSFLYFLKMLPVKIALQIIRWSGRNKGIKKYAEQEFRAVGWPGDCDMQALLCQQLVDLLLVFSFQGHSGMSAPYVVTNFQQLASHKPLGPLTGEDDEWTELAYDGEVCWQNKRCFSVFKEADGRAYHSDGLVFTDEDGCAYTNIDSRVYIDKFPYTPETKHIDRKTWEAQQKEKAETAQRLSKIMPTSFDGN